MADGNQGHAPSQDHGATSANHLYVEPGAVPALRDAFADALAKVDRQLELAGHDLRITGWALDPVSTDATAAFNARSVDAAESALGTLLAYRNQLSTAVETLDRTAEQYRVADEDNSVTVGKQEGEA
ncbi:MAG: transcriptional regulator [Labedaea sp.]